MKWTQLQDEVSVVFVGSFNPGIFQPYWFALNELLRPAEAEKATIEFIVDDVASFKTEWLDLNVVRNKLTLRTPMEPYSRHLYDLAVGTMRKLPHTPVQRLGINRTLVLEFSTEEDWHEFGHFLAPKVSWEELFSKPGLKSMTMEGVRGDDTKGGTFVTVEAIRARQAAFRVNDHYEVQDVSKTVGCTEILAILEQRFFESQQASKRRVERLIAIYGEHRDSKSAA